MSADEPRRAEAGSIQRLLAVRMVLVAVVTTVILAAALLVMQSQLQGRAARQLLDSAVHHFVQRSAEIDAQWQREAELLAAQIGFTGLLDVEDARLRQARLTAYFTSLGGLGTFSQVQLLDADGRRLLGHSSGAAMVDLPPGDTKVAWSFVPAERVVYRVLRKVVRLGRHDSGTLALLVPLDNALLNANASGDTLVSLHWKDVDDVAQSQVPLLARRADVVAWDDVLEWHGDPSGPCLHVTRFVVPAISRGEMAVVITVGGALACALGWVVLGAALRRFSRRLSTLAQAMTGFTRSRTIDPQLERELPQALVSPSREMRELFASFSDLADSVARAEAAQTQAQQSLRELNAELEHRVDQRTGELASARDAAVAATRAKEAFLANMSHELRTPLSGLLGGLELLDREQLPAPQRPMFDRAKQAGEALLSVINDVLDYSKIGAGKLELQSQPFAPAELLTEVAALLDASARRKGLELLVRVDAHAPLHVRADRLRLRQILLNLTSNAIKFTDHGRVELALAAGDVEPGTVWLRFEVNDSGPGIDVQTQALLFEPFMQGDTGPQRRAGGSGLGLAISQRLAVAMGSRIVLRSAPGKGAQFSFVLRCPESQPVQPRDAGLPLPRLSGRILLVEDNEVNRLVTVALLERLGLKVDACVNGLEALAWLEHHRPDLILMDCQMPELDGFAATARIREAERQTGRPRCPIVALTANALSGDAKRCLDAGMDDHLPKPFSHPHFASMLARWLPASGAA